jgi:hypothetical protein
VLLYVAGIWSKNDKHITGPMMHSAVSRWLIQYTGLIIYFWPQSVFMVCINIFIYLTLFSVWYHQALWGLLY